jgi:hypothetical protein
MHFIEYVTREYEFDINDIQRYEQKFNFLLILSTLLITIIIILSSSRDAIIQNSNTQISEINLSGKRNIEDETHINGKFTFYLYMGVVII